MVWNFECFSPISWQLSPKRSFSDLTGFFFSLFIRFFLNFRHQYPSARSGVRCRGTG